ncbi:MAG: hypothetical protein ACPL7R_07515 [Anaerolineae bacterium]
MGLSANADMVLLGLAYATLLAAVGLWLADYVRPVWRAQAIARALAWAAAALTGAYLLAEAVVQHRPLFVSVADFLAAGAVGALAVAPFAGRGKASLVGPLVLGLAALTHVLTAQPASPTAVSAQQTLLYAAQASLHGLGMGACIAALLGALGEVAVREERRLADGIGIVVMGAGFVLSSAWAWLNWGTVWRNDPRLNLMVSGWLCVVAGRLLRRDGARWGLVAQWLGVALMLVGVFAADLVAAGWPGLAFVAW